jgi:hypothetical protein
MSTRVERLFEEAIPPGPEERAKAEAEERALESENDERKEALGALRDSRGWEVLKGEMARQRGFVLATVMNPNMDIERIRYAQGILEVLGILTKFVEGDKV